ncbi:MAG: NAD(P)-dependent alcohol dehydrogenase [Vicinamibacteria bacterium]|nr:NAD(P)-dependent alcohol dehydrogenase [Vicinamibacteria bacterium]
MKTTPARAYAAFDKSSPLRPFDLQRRAPGARDVAFDVHFCGVCHSDLHTARSEWPGTVYPCVPGHEIVGQVTAVGSAVTRFKAGDRVAVGCMVDSSCRTCASCKDGLEQYCDNHGTVYTYNSVDKHGAGPVTYGGYSSHMVVDEDFCLRLAEKLDPAAAAPLLCAGITTWSPLKHWGAGPGKRVGVVGLGGLGHMALKLAHALGAHTTLFTTSAGKAADAKRLGADEVVISKDADAMAKCARSLDLIVDTVSASHDLDPLTNALRRDGALVLVGVPEHGNPAPAVVNLIFGRRSIAGSLIGGIRETQEMLDFCAEKGVVADIERIRPDQIDEAYARMLKSDVRYRFVIDMAPLRA